MASLQVTKAVWIPSWNTINLTKKASWKWVILQVFFSFFEEDTSSLQHQHCSVNLKKQTSAFTITHKIWRNPSRWLPLHNLINTSTNQLRILTPTHQEEYDQTTFRTNKLLIQKTSQNNKCLKNYNLQHLTFDFLLSTDINDPTKLLQKMRTPTVSYYQKHKGTKNVHLKTIKKIF